MAMSKVILEAGANRDWRNEIGKYVFKQHLLRRAGLTFV